MTQEFYMWIVFGLTFLTMILYSLDKIRMEIISLFSIVVLLLVFQNSPILGLSSEHGLLNNPGFKSSIPLIKP